jgi:hypothetical protein
MAEGIGREDMTDEELVKRLRERQEFEFIDEYKRVEWEDEDALEAADRIEALLNLNEALVELMDGRDAKLAKAVEGLDKAAALIEDRHVVHMTSKGRNPKDYISDWSLIAKEVRALLAEIEGEKG